MAMSYPKKKKTFPRFRKPFSFFNVYVNKTFIIEHLKMFDIWKSIKQFLGYNHHVIYPSK